MNQRFHSANSPLLHYILQARLYGYTDDLRVTGLGLHLIHDLHYFGPSQVVINDTYHFTVATDPSENSIVYLVETVDGKKGILINGCGTYADPVLASFIKQVELSTKNKRDE